MHRARSTQCRDTVAASVPVCSGSATYLVPSARERDPRQCVLTFVTALRALYNQYSNVFDYVFVCSGSATYLAPSAHEKNPRQ